MLRGFLAALGAVSIIIELTSTVYAKPRLSFQSETSVLSHSDQSLQGVDSRSISKDYPSDSITSSRSQIDNATVPNVAKARAHHIALPFLSDKVTDRLQFGGIGSGDSFSSKGTLDPLSLNRENDNYNQNFAVLYKLNR